MKNKRKLLALLLAMLMVMSVLAACGSNDDDDSNQGDEPDVLGVEPQGTLILATTTSTKESGLLDFIIPDFEEKTGWEVDVISVGSGEAMKMGEEGEADVLLVHSPAAEAAFVEGGHADEDGRMDVMYNDFIILGPKDDPVGAAENAGEDAVAALTAIAEAEAVFISRADNSGTHTKELSLWEKAGISPEGAWYVEANDSMLAVITMADEMGGYILSDRATWLTNSDKADLMIVSEKDPSGVLYNQYGVICVNPEKNDLIKHDGAKAFQEWITSKDTQDLIATFGVAEYGDPLFTPNAE